MAIPSSELSFEFAGTFYRISKVPYDSAAGGSFKVDQSAVSAVVVEPASNAPSATLGSADSNFEKTVSLAAAGSANAGTVTVVTAYTGSTLASSKP